MQLINHIENHLGKITESWKLKDSFDVQILKFESQPSTGITTYCTLGLSNFELPHSNEKTFFQEIVFSINEDVPDEIVASFMLTFTEYILNSKKPLLRGQLIEFKENIISNTLIKNIYCTHPVFFEDSFAILKNDNSFDIIFVWIIPLATSDSNFIKENGWNEFENKLEEINQEAFWDLKLSLVIDSSESN